MIFNKNKNESTDAQSQTLLQRFYQLFYPKFLNSFEFSCEKDGQSLLQVKGPGGLFYQLRLPNLEALRTTGQTDVSVSFRVSEQHPIQNFTLPFKAWLKTKDLPLGIDAAHETIKQGLDSLGLQMEQAQEIELEFSDKRIARTNAPDLAFKGRVVASADAPFRNGRNTVFTVYETDKGKWVAVKTGQSLLPGENVRQETVVVDKLSDISAFFGFSATAKKIYDMLNIDASEQI